MYSFGWCLQGHPACIRHGWPLIFAERRVVVPFPANFDELIGSVSLWNLGGGLTTFSLCALAADAVVAIFIVAAAAAALRLWSATAWPKQFTVRTLLAAMVLVALAGPYLRHHDEPLQLLLGSPSQHPYTVDVVEIRGAGPAWVRQIIGPWPLSRFDKITGLSSDGASEIPPWYVKLTPADAQKLAVYGDVQHVGLREFELDREGLAELARLPRLARILLLGCRLDAQEVLGIRGELLPGGKYKVPRGWYSVVRSPDGPTFCGPEPLD
jgi:hypothetical protein